MLSKSFSNQKNSSEEISCNECSEKLDFNTQYCPKCGSKINILQLSFFTSILQTLAFIYIPFGLFVVIATGLEFYRYFGALLVIIGAASLSLEKNSDNKSLKTIFRILLLISAMIIIYNIIALFWFINQGLRG